jgi:hypothetical protein
MPQAMPPPPGLHDIDDGQSACPWQLPLDASPIGQEMANSTTFHDPLAHVARTLQP